MPNQRQRKKRAAANKKAEQAALRASRQRGRRQPPKAEEELLKPTEDDILKFLSAKVHIGHQRAHVNMKRYIWKKRQDGINIINLQKTWHKLILAARMLVTVNDPQDIVVLSSRKFGQRAAIKFASHTGARAIVGKWINGSFTNPRNKSYIEPRLVVVDDPRSTFAALVETSYVGIPVISLCNTDNNTRFVDCAIPCNNRGKYSIGLLFWLLAREVQRMRGQIPRDINWNNLVSVDLFFYRDPDEIARQQEKQNKGDQQDAYEDFDAGAQPIVQADRFQGGQAQQVYEMPDEGWADQPPDVGGFQDWGYGDYDQAGGYGQQQVGGDYGADQQQYMYQPPPAQDVGQGGGGYDDQGQQPHYMDGDIEQW